MQEYKPFKEGKVREIYDIGDNLVMVATDRISAFDHILKNKVKDKGAILTQMSRFWFQSTEDVIFGCLSSTAPSEEISIKLFNGIQIKRKYIKEKKYSKGMFQGISCPEHVNIKASLSKYYNGQVNRKLFGS